MGGSKIAMHSAGSVEMSFDALNERLLVAIEAVWPVSGIVKTQFGYHIIKRLE